MKRIMGTLLVAEAIFSPRFYDDFEDECHRITMLAFAS